MIVPAQVRLGAESNQHDYSSANRRMVKKFVFTITTGRSGTCFLSHLFMRNVRQADVFHERINFDSFGLHTPEISHLMLFNTVGNVSRVREFWEQKFARDQLLPQLCYMETSQMLAKAGLLENLDILESGGHTVHVLILRRNTFDIFWSLVDRGDFRHLGGHTWLHWLDPRYHNRILSPEPFMKENAGWGSAAWYVSEVFVRAEYYRLLLADRPQVYVHDVHLEEIVRSQGARELLSALGMLSSAEQIDLPPKVNARQEDDLPSTDKARAREFFKRHALDTGACQALARQYYESGARLGTGGFGVRDFPGSHSC